MPPRMYFNAISVNLQEQILPGMHNAPKFARKGPLMVCEHSYPRRRSETGF